MVHVKQLTPWAMTVWLLSGTLSLPVRAEVAPQIPPASPIAQAVLTPSHVNAALRELDTLALTGLQKTGVPGLAIAVVYQDQVVYLKGFGVRAANKPDRVDPDTVFQLASVSKPIAATVMAGLVGDGVVAWSDPIIRHDPSFQLHNPALTHHVTLGDLFAHRSGLPAQAGDDLEDIGFDRATILQRLRYLPIGNRFRANYAYTNFGLTAAAVAAAKTAGKSWEDLSAIRLYQPLGMQQTSSRYRDFLAAPNRVTGHTRVNDRWVAQDRRNADAQSPAGGVSSTVRDLAQWLRLQLGNGTIAGRTLIQAAALAETHRPQMISRAPEDAARDRAGFYGLGWNVSYTDQGLVQLSHSGGFNLGTATAVYLLPSEAIGIVVLTNASPIGLPESIAVSFLELVQSGTVKRDYLSLFQARFQDMNQPTYGTVVNNTPPLKQQPPLPNSSYVGTYRNEYFGDLEIAARNGKLVLQLGPQKQAYALQHYDRDVFTYQPEGENAFGLSAVTFRVGANGKGETVTIENLNQGQQGTFHRVTNRPDSTVHSVAW